MSLSNLELLESPSKIETFKLVMGLKLGKDLEQIMKEIRKDKECAKEATTLVDQFKKKSGAETWTFFKNDPTSQCFRIRFPNQTERNWQGVSVALPSDVNKHMSAGDFTYETILIASSESSSARDPIAEGKLVYNASIGYEDVCRFCTREEVWEELVRLSKVR